MLDSLHIKNFRCFEDLTIPSLGRVNLIVGKNNVGKSTLLEAVYLYSNNGSALAIAKILFHRNDFFFNLKKNPRLAFNNLRKIFNKSDPDAELSISSADKPSLKITYTLNLIDLKIKKHALTQEIYRNIPYNNNMEGFLVENTVSFEIRPDELENQLHQINTASSPCSLSTTVLLDENSISNIWTNIQKQANEDEAIRIMRIIDPNIINLFFADEEEDDYGTIKTKKVAYLRLKSPTQVRTLKSMGEGVTRLLQFSLLAFTAKGGYLLIDEFENGLHYSIQEEIWEKLFKLTKELDIQVFATTHSEDTVKAFCKISLQSPEVGKIIYLARHMREKDPNKGKISSIIYDENDLKLIIQTGMEIR